MLQPRDYSKRISKQCRMPALPLKTQLIVFPECFIRGPIYDYSNGVTAWLSEIVTVISNSPVSCAMIQMLIASLGYPTLPDLYQGNLKVAFFPITLLCLVVLYLNTFYHFVYDPILLSQHTHTNACLLPFGPPAYHNMVPCLPPCLHAYLSVCLSVCLSIHPSFKISSKHTYEITRIGRYQSADSNYS